MHLPANAANARFESRGEVAASSTGATLTASATANTKGTWVALGGATGFAYEGIVVHLGQGSTAADWIVDIGIDDGSGNRFVLVPDLRFTGLRSAEGTMHYSIPVHVPAGALLFARCASSVASATVRTSVLGCSQNLGGYPGYSRVVALNAFATSRGVAVDPGATANDKGAWAQIIASTPVDVEAIFCAIGHNGDISRAAAGLALLDIGIGSASSEFSIIKDAFFCWNSIYDGPALLAMQPFPAKIPSGSRVAARMSCGHATAGDRTIDLSVYGLAA